MAPPRKKRARSWRSDARAQPRLEAALRRLGRRIRALRLERKLTQEQAAANAHLDDKHFQAIEYGQSNITFASLLAIARGLDVQLEDLVRGM